MFHNHLIQNKKISTFYCKITKTICSQKLSCGPAAAAVFIFSLRVCINLLGSDAWEKIHFLGAFMFRYMMQYSSFSSWISHFLACMGSCIGCCDKSQPITAVDEPSKGLRIQGQLVRKPSLSDDFWSTSTCDLLDNSMLQSQRSYSSISISNQSLSQLSGNGSASNPPEFVNHGHLHWSQSRLQWLGTKKPQTHKKTQEPVLCWNASYENLLGTSKRFPQPVPLSEMVDFLVDIWDQEGLYD